MSAPTLWKALPVVLFMVAILLFGYVKTVDSANPKYPIKWQSSQWITTPTSGANGYFRKVVSLADVPNRAVLTVSASDNFTVYVNGKKIGDKRARSVQSSMVLDVTSRLNAGNNILAFEVKKSTFPAQAYLRFELLTIDHVGLASSFVSNEHAAVASQLPPVQGQLYWYDTSYNATTWATPKIADSVDNTSLLSVAPDLFLTLPIPQQFTIFGDAYWKVNLTKTLDVNRDTQQVWFALASTAPYELIVNDVSAGMFSASNQFLSLSSIRSRLHEGKNDIRISLFTGGEAPRIAGGLIIESHQAVVTSQYIDERWKVGREAALAAMPTEVSGEAKKLTPIQLALSSEQPVLTLSFNDDFVPPALATSAPWFMFISALLVTLCLIVFFKAAGLSNSQLLDGFALPSIIGLLALLIAWFIAQDVRFNAREIFSSANILMLMGVWLLLTVVALTQHWLHRKKHAHLKVLTSSDEPVLGVINQYLYGLVAFSIVAVAFVLRIDGIGQQALTVDEATIAGFARGVVDRGYPYLMVGGMEVELATYELVPYFLAASVSIFGYSDIGLRIPALLFGTMTCGVLIYCGTAWFGRLAGLIAGLLYAVSPWAIYWAQNCFHPSQIQFFNLLTLIAFYRLLTADQISLRLAVISALAFAMSYLSWEGSGLVLPVMAIVAIVIRWGNWRWFFQINLWVAAMLILFVVAGQGIRRMLLQEPFIMVGFGKSDLSAPKLTFTESTYEPFYYIQNFFFTEFNAALSLFFIAGLVLMFFDRKLSFVVLFVVTAYLSLTNLLGYYNAHYFYFVLPVFLLAVSAAFVKGLILLQRMSLSVSGIPGRVQGSIAGGLLTVLLFAPATAGVMHLYRFMAGGIDEMRVDYRPDLAGMDGRTVSLALQHYQRKDDVVLSTIPLISEHYVGEKGDYFIQTITDRKVVYDTQHTRPYYVDKFVGNPVLRSREELQDVLQKHSRVLFVAAPVNGLSRIIDEETLAFINDNMTVLAESYDSRLYLWEK